MSGGGRAKRTTKVYRSLTGSPASSSLVVVDGYIFAVYYQPPGSMDRFAILDLHQWDISGALRAPPLSLTAPGARTQAIGSALVRCVVS